MRPRKRYLLAAASHHVPRRPVNGRRHGCVGVVRPITALWRTGMASDDALAEGQGQGRRRWFGGRGSTSEARTQERESNMAPTEPGIEESVEAESLKTADEPVVEETDDIRVEQDGAEAEPVVAPIPAVVPETLASLRARGGEQADDDDRRSPASSRSRTRRVASARPRPPSTSAPRSPSSDTGSWSSTSTRRATRRPGSGSATAMSRVRSTTSS